MNLFERDETGQLQHEDDILATTYSFFPQHDDHFYTKTDKIAPRPRTNKISEYFLSTADLHTENNLRPAGNPAATRRYSSRRFTTSFPLTTAAYYPCTISSRSRSSDEEILVKFNNNNEEILSPPDVSTTISSRRRRNEQQQRVLSPVPEVVALQSRSATSSRHFFGYWFFWAF